MAEAKCSIEKGDSKKGTPDMLHIRLPLQKPMFSKSRKTKVVATTNGNQRTECTLDGYPITVGVNAYYKDEECE